eukprot:5171288-Pyramimonas_sp.AAC.1
MSSAVSPGSNAARTEKVFMRFPRCCRGRDLCIEIALVLHAFGAPTSHKPRARTADRREPHIVYKIEMGLSNQPSWKAADGNSSRETDP